jgi:hypothetical protein
VGSEGPGPARGCHVGCHVPTSPEDQGLEPWPVLQELAEVLLLQLLDWLLATAAWNPRQYKLW